MMVRDLIRVERDLGFSYNLDGGGHYQEICPRCRRAMFGLAQAGPWSERLTDRVGGGA
jgi:hypothetical protein